MGKPTAILVAGVALAGLVGFAAPAHASGRCLFQGDWDCYGSPQWNGPGLNTSNVPGTYGGWTTNQVVCSPVTYECWQVASP